MKFSWPTFKECIQLKFMCVIISNFGSMPDTNKTQESSAVLCLNLPNCRGK